jgi:hypothetical protein
MRFVVDSLQRTAKTARPGPRGLHRHTVARQLQQHEFCRRQSADVRGRDDPQRHPAVDDADADEDDAPPGFGTMLAMFCVARMINRVDKRLASPSNCNSSFTLL